MLLAKTKRKEVRWSELRDSGKLEFKDAMAKEITKWLRYWALRKMSRKSMKSQNPMRMRRVLTCKTSGKAKARLLSWDLKIMTAAPTASKRARNPMLAVAAKHRWGLSKGDVTAAFLQGDLAGESGPVYVDPPSEARGKLDTTEDDVCELTRPGYGRINAPRCWWKKVKKGF